MDGQQISPFPLFLCQHSCDGNADSVPMGLQRNIPYLLQIFVELFGGFYAEDSDDLELMSKISGIPAEDVIECIKMYDEFFPFGNSWFYRIKGELTCMKLVPGFVKGAGLLFSKEC